MRTRTLAITSSTKIATVAVVIVVALVLGLLYASFLPTTSTKTTLTTGKNIQQISVQGATLFSGSPSKQSYNATCNGDAVLSLELFNPTSTAIHITNVTLYGPTFKGTGTTLVSLPNACLTISQGIPTLAPDSSYNFVSYSDVPLQLGQAYNYTIQFDNGQEFLNQTLLAQSE